MFTVEQRASKSEEGRWALAGCEFVRRANQAEAPNVLPLTRAVLHTAGASQGNDTPSITANGTAPGAAAELDAGRSQKRFAQIMTNDAGLAAANEP